MPAQDKSSADLDIVLGPRNARKVISRSTRVEIASFASKCNPPPNTNVGTRAIVKHAASKVERCRILLSVE
jgi:hypothetical protein